MAQASTQRQEYWRPANPDLALLMAPDPAESLCWNCGKEYSPAARFCEVCGSRRDPRPQPAATAQAAAKHVHKANVEFFPRHESVPVISLVCFVLGVACFVGAGLMSFIYRTDTLLDWEAVQIWRIQWLLSALAAFLAGVLLKRDR